jgi:hypothetical protein
MSRRREQYRTPDTERRLRASRHCPALPCRCTVRRPDAAARPIIHSHGMPAALRRLLHGAFDLFDDSRPARRGGRLQGGRRAVPAARHRPALQIVQPPFAASGLRLAAALGRNVRLQPRPGDGLARRTRIHHPTHAAMSPPGRPKGEYRSAQHEGTPVSPPGRRQPEAAVLRQARDRPQGGRASGLSPKGEDRSAEHDRTPVSGARPAEGPCSAVRSSKVLQ